MYRQERLIEALNAELLAAASPPCCKIYQAYEKYCGSLRLEELFTTDTVYIAAKRCAAGFMQKNDTWYYQQEPWQNSRLLCQKVLTGRFKPRYYRQKVIIERGKPRTIRPPAYECKVVQKVLCDYLVRPLLEPRMIPTNYASIRGRGTKKLYEDVAKALNRAPERYETPMIVMGDFSSYFANIDVGILMDDILGRYIRDQRVLELIRLFSPEELGLSLGNELSQIPASYFPTLFDHYCKDRMGWEYFRYMDDSLAILPQNEVEAYLEAFHQYAARLHITIKDEKTQVLRMGDPFVYCKERFLWDKRKRRYYHLMNPDIERNETRKLKAFAEKKAAKQITQQQIDLQYRGVVGAIKSHPNSYRTRERLAVQYKKTLQKEGAMGNESHQESA